MAGLSLAPLVQAETDMYGRVCPRVVNRFSNDPVMWARVNARVEKRFGFVCAPTSQQSLSSSSASAPKQQYAQCTAAAWFCSPFNARCENGLLKQNCSLIDRSCLNPEAVRPQPPRCGSSSSAPVYNPYANLEKWDEMHKKLVEQAKELAHQKNGSPCIKELHEIEQEFVLRYNEYLAYLNSPGNFQYKPALRTIEEAMRKLEERFRKAPVVCF